LSAHCRLPSQVTENAFIDETPVSLTDFNKREGGLQPPPKKDMDYGPSSRAGSAHADGHDRTIRISYDPFGSTAEKKVIDPLAALGTQNNE
jgi:hypothetical protein